MERRPSATARASGQSHRVKTIRRAYGTPGAIRAFPSRTGTAFVLKALPHQAEISWRHTMSFAR